MAGPIGSAMKPWKAKLRQFDTTAQPIAAQAPGLFSKAAYNASELPAFQSARESALGDLAGRQARGGVTGGMAERQVQSLDIELEQLQQEANSLFGVRPKKTNFLAGVKTTSHAIRQPGRMMWTPEVFKQLEGRIEELLRRFPEGLTTNMIKDQLKVHYRYVASTVRSLVKRGALRPIMVGVPMGPHGVRKFPGYALPLQAVKKEAA